MHYSIKNHVVAHLSLRNACNTIGTRESIAQGVMLGSPEAWKGRNSVNTCLNGASEVSISIYKKSRCQWSGCLIDLEPEPQRYGHLKLQRP